MFIVEEISEKIVHFLIRSRDLAKIGQIAYPPHFFKGLDIEDLYY